jgi:hypothetical protein
MTAPSAPGRLASARTDPGPGFARGYPESGHDSLALHVFDLIFYSIKINEHMYDAKGQAEIAVARNQDDEE